MALSEEQALYIGECLDCGASCYRLPSGKLWVDDPAPGCLCRVGREEDKAEERENLILNIIKGQEEGDHGD